MSIKRLLISAGALFSAFALIFSYTQTAQAAFPGENGRIVYSENSGDGNFALFTVKPDGTGIIDLEEEGNDPMFSPDDSKIAYIKLGTGNSIWVMDSDGTNETEIFTPDTNDAVIDLAWSPDGEQLVFEYVYDFFDDGVADKESDLRIINSDGSGSVADLEGAAEADIRERDPHWNPAGGTIVFVREDDDVDSGNGQIYAVDEAGGTADQLADTQGSDLEHPQYSPDGDNIAYVSVEARDQSSIATESYIYTMTAAGASNAQLTDASSGVEWDPAYSPDGEQIVFHTGAAGGLDDSASSGELEVIDVDGANQTALGISEVEEPDWGSPRTITVEPECTTEVGEKCTDFTPEVPEICQVAGLAPTTGAFGETVTSGGFGYQPEDNTAGTQEFTYQETDDNTLDTTICNFTVTFIPKAPDTGEKSGLNPVVAVTGALTAATGLGLIVRRRLLA